MFNKRSIRLTIVSLFVAAAVFVPQFSNAVAPVNVAKASIDCNSLTGGVYPNIPTLNLSDLYNCRPEVGDTLALIASDGPFTMRHDDGVFTNAQQLMPPLDPNSYREYTVVTPGASTRGTRRIMTDGDPSRDAASYSNAYYTDDHYNTVWLVYDDTQSSNGGMSANAVRANGSHARPHLAHKGHVTTHKAKGR